MGILLAFAGGCVSKPVQLHVLDSATGNPIADVDVRQHGARFFQFIPRKGDAPKTDGDGRIDLVLNARGTSLALLRPGYVPTGLSIVPEPKGSAKSLEPPLLKVDVSPENSIDFERLADHAVIDVRLNRIVPWQLRLCVRDEAGAALPAAEAIVETGLFLPKDGTESEWGRPPIQRLETDATGCVVVTAHRGLRNYLYVRMVGRATQRIALDRLDGNERLDVTLARVASKPAILRAIDGNSGAPIANATVELGKQFDGIARDPNGWSVKTDANGCTPEVLVPDMDQIVVSVSGERFRARRQVLCWQSLGTKRPIQIALDRK